MAFKLSLTKPTAIPTALVGLWLGASPITTGTVSRMLRCVATDPGASETKGWTLRRRTEKKARKQRNTVNCPTSRKGNVYDVRNGVSGSLPRCFAPGTSSPSARWWGWRKRPYPWPWRRALRGGRRSRSRWRRPRCRPATRSSKELETLITTF